MALRRIFCGPQLQVKKAADLTRPPGWLMHLESLFFFFNQGKSFIDVNLLNVKYVKHNTK